MIRVTARQPFDALFIQALPTGADLNGYLVLVLPEPADSVDLRVTLHGGLQGTTLQCAACLDDECGVAGEFVYVPATP